MKLFGYEIKGFPQALAVLAAVLLVSSGLCGVQWVVVSASNGLMGAVGGLIALLGAIELAMMLFSAIGIIAVLLAWPIYVYGKKLSDRSAQPTEHIENTGDKNEE
ncbi:hypothetical protein [Acidicapsa acidisoli]|uniref:hypothetical protein n=1 Tax=Acidicapsa acidisoli TaxID=1615681 RepID=UPI0021E0DCC8|nr:hypothetical protein [Acidicapsa acidisoli]